MSKALEQSYKLITSKFEEHLLAIVENLIRDRDSLKQQVEVHKERMAELEREQIQQKAEINQKSNTIAILQTQLDCAEKMSATNNSFTKSVMDLAKEFSPNIRKETDEIDDDIPTTLILPSKALTSKQTMEPLVVATTSKASLNASNDQAPSVLNQPIPMVADEVVEVVEIDSDCDSGKSVEGKDERIQPDMLTISAAFSL